MWFLSRNISRVNARWRRAIWAKGQFWQKSKRGEKISRKYIQPRELSNHLSGKSLQRLLGWSHRHNLWDLKVEPDHCMKRSEWQGCLALTRQDAPNVQVLLSKKPMKMEMSGGFAGSLFVSWQLSIGPSALKISTASYQTLIQTVPWSSYLHVLQSLYNGKRCISVKTVLQRLSTVFLITAEGTKYAFQDHLTHQPALNSKCHPHIKQKFFQNCHIISSMKVAPLAFPPSSFSSFLVVAISPSSFKPVVTHRQTAGLVSVGRKQQVNRALFSLFYIGKQFLAKNSSLPKSELSHSLGYSNLVQHNQLLDKVSFSTKHVICLYYYSSINITLLILWYQLCINKK